jgi:hypothetical protein
MKKVRKQSQRAIQNKQRKRSKKQTPLMQAVKSVERSLMETLDPYGEEDWNDGVVEYVFIREGNNVELEYKSYTIPTCKIDEYGRSTNMTYDDIYGHMAELPSNYLANVVFKILCRDNKNDLPVNGRIIVGLFKLNGANICLATYDEMGENVDDDYIANKCREIYIRTIISGQFNINERLLENTIFDTIHNDLKKAVELIAV